ncbi:MAG: apolipoprotein N-acyltransferase [Bacteroidales bacterium]|nr:apolipoprotein N-acyltransferase [Bacteroidales bacterium]
MKKIRLIALSVLSGVLFSMAWPVNGFPALLFFAFVPLLLIEKYVFENRQSYLTLFLYIYPAFLIWNILTTWWIWLSTPVAVAAWVLNALFMTIVILLFHATRRNISGRNRGYIFFVLYWAGFEFLHIQWELSWTWLNLGNGLAGYNKWIQWYEYTGSLGGTVWILTVNYLIFNLFDNSITGIRSIKRITGCIAVSLLVIFLPIAVSFYIYNHYEEGNSEIEVIVVQPNLDPYSEQYEIPPLQVVDLNLNLALSHLGEERSFIVCPESTIQENIWEENLEASKSLGRIKSFLENHSNARIVIGASTFRRYSEGQELPYSARHHSDYDFWYDAFNTAFFLDNSDSIQYHHKTMLTLGVEKMPSWRILKPLQNLAIDLGGTIGTLGTDDNPGPFVTDDTVVIAPLICYESVYGEYCTGFVKKGANVFFIITNDGWWGNTPGHKQHLSFASIRAIECRRSIARSANTGISALIDQRGDMHQTTRYWEPDVIAGRIRLNERITFYAKYGDFLGRIAAFMSVLSLLLTIAFLLKRKNKLPAS